MVVKDLSRLGRNSISTGYYVEKHFPLREVRFIAVTDNFDTASDKGNSSGIILPLKNMINEAYSMDIAKKIKAQQQQAMREGQYVGSRPPYGYKKSPTDCHKLIVDENTAPIVKRIFEMASTEMGLAPICRALNEDNVLTPSEYAQSQGIINNKKLVGSGAWQTRTISKILSAEVYTGDLVQGKSKSVNRKQMPNSEDNWIIVENTHEAIIDKELFAKVQKIRDEKSVKRIGSDWTENIFKGKIFCGDCGKNLHRQRVPRAKDIIYIFHCITNTRIAQGSCNSHIYFKEDDLKQAVVNIVQLQTDVLIGNNLLLLQKQKEINQQTEKINTELTTLAKEVAKNQKYLKTLYENLILGIIDLPEYKELKAGYEDKIQKGRDKHLALSTQKDAALKEIKDFTEVTKDLKSICSADKLNRELIEKLIDKIVVKDNNEIDIIFTYKNSFPLLEEVFNRGK